MEYLKPALITWLRLSMEESCPSAPMKVCTAMQSAFMRMASATSTATTSWLRSSLSMEEPLETRNAIALRVSGGTQVRSAPLVPIRQSMEGMSFGITRSRRSRPAVLPMK